MSNKAIIKDGVVVNIGIASPTDKPAANVVPIPDGLKVAIGYLYDGKNFTEPSKPQEDIEKLISVKVENLNRSLQNYVYSAYDMGTQASFQCLYLLPTVSEQSKADITNVWEWIQSILIYYYQCKETLLSTKDIASAKNFVYNFGQFNATKPTASLSAILKELM